MTALIIALDVGGSAIKSGLIALEGGGRVLEGPLKATVASDSDQATILGSIAESIRRLLPASGVGELQGMAVAIPGPFDYEKGISLIRGVAKYDGIYGLDVGQALQEDLTLPDLLIRFQNDAESAILGEVLYGAGRGYERIIGITLGTGLGSAFIVAHFPVQDGPGVPTHGWLYNEHFDGQTADELFSDRGLRQRLFDACGRHAVVADYATVARAGEKVLRDAFLAFGRDLGEFLQPYIVNFRADLLLVLGGIAQAYDLFGPALESRVPVPVKNGDLGTAAALLGVATLFQHYTASPRSAR